jgi:hypothetical protein
MEIKRRLLMDTLTRNFDTSTVDRMSRVTLNGGFVKGMDNEDSDLIAKYLANNKVTPCQPAAAPGTEISRSTRGVVAAARRAYRAKNKNKN